MPERVVDPTPDEIADRCRMERLQWSEEQRYEAISDLPKAALTDYADQLFLEEQAKGRRHSALDCQIMVGAIDEEEDLSFQEQLESYDYHDPYIDDVELPFDPERLIV